MFSNDNKGLEALQEHIKTGRPNVVAKYKVRGSSTSVDTGPKLEIVEMNFFKGGLQVKLVSNQERLVIDIRTTDPQILERFLRSSIGGRAPQTGRVKTGSDIQEPEWLQKLRKNKIHLIVLLIMFIVLGTVIAIQLNN